MNYELEKRLQEDFPFMKQNRINKERNTYRHWGCECSDGWYNILYDCCQKITDIYKAAGIKVDFVPAQIKEKFGTLRFYFGYEDAPCGIAAVDYIDNGSSIRFEPKNEQDNEGKKKLRKEIACVVQFAEERSKHTCEICGTENTTCIRIDLGWVKTLCDNCYSERIKVIEEKKNKLKLKKKEFYDDIKNEGDK